jgi:hypothetical protein
MKYIETEKKPKYNSESRAFSKDVLIYNTGGNKRGNTRGGKNSNINIDNYKLINRIKNYGKLRKILSLLDEYNCLEKKVFNEENGYTINNIINLEKKFGTKSKNGTIYLTSIPNFHITYPIAAKLMTYNEYNILEIDIMIEIVNNILLKQLSRHFIMIYGYTICNKQIDEKLRLVSINELATGDLKTLLNNKIVLKDNELILNILFQTFISIATFHNTLGYIHNDTHHGNFLYQDNNEVGYYHYIFNDKDYYLKSCKYNIMIYDFGFAKKINSKKEKKNKENKKIYKDYKKICHAFINETNYGWISSPILPDIYITTIVKNIKNFLIKNINSELTNNSNNDDNKSFSFRLFANIIDQIFLEYTPENMFITKRPPNIINDIPFIIG